MTTTASRFEELLSVQGKFGMPPRMRSAPPTGPVHYNFGTGNPDQGSFPYDDLIEAHTRMIKEVGAEALSYGDPQGYLELREIICRKHELFEGLKIGPENLLICNGSAHALTIGLMALVDRGDPVICEAPTFMGTLRTMRGLGADLLDVPMDDEGMVTSAVRERLEQLARQGRRCKLIYTIVNFHNPSGPSMSLRRRQELIALAREFRTMILEDDAYGELRWEGEPLPSLFALDESAVLRTGTLSKILGAGTRIGWICAAAEVIPTLQSFGFFGGPQPYMSRLAAYYLQDHLEEHVTMLRGIYRAKRDAMLRGLWEELEGTDVEVSKPEGGFFIWIKVPTATNMNQLAELAQEAGVTYVPGQAFFANGGGERNIRLAFSADSQENCYEGAKALGKAIRESMI